MHARKRLELPLWLAVRMLERFASEDNNPGNPVQRFLLLWYTVPARHATLRREATIERLLSFAKHCVVALVSADPVPVIDVLIRADRWPYYLALRFATCEGEHADLFPQDDEELQELKQLARAHLYSLAEDALCALDGRQVVSSRRRTARDVPIMLH